jgi:hypothetical protein
MRWLWPVLMFAIAGWVAFYNSSHTDRKLLFPFVDAIFPDLAGDPAAMGERSVLLLLGVAGVVTLLTFIEQLRAIARRAQRREDEESLK